MLRLRHSLLSLPFSWHSLLPLPLAHCSVLFCSQNSSSADHSSSPSLSSNSSSSVTDSNCEANDHLLDTFGRFHNYLRVSLVEKCNLRCVYCMPEEGVPLCPSSSYLSAAEIVRLVRLFAQNGVEKVRLTGGEPTIRKDLVPIVRDLAALPQIRRIGMTTNGIVLNRMLIPLMEAGLTHLNISLDTLSAEKYANITRRNAFTKAIGGIEAAERILPEGRLKINCVVMRGVNDEEITDFVMLTAERSLDIRFIEFMPFSGNRFKMDSFVAYKEMLAKLEEHFGKEQIQRLKDAPNDSSKAYKVKGHRGQFGFITSMSEHFCGSCNRLRLTADGNLKVINGDPLMPLSLFSFLVCLHGLSEVSLRDPLRNENSFCDFFSGGRGRRQTFGTDRGGGEAETRATRGSREAHSNCKFSPRAPNDSNWRLSRSVPVPSPFLPSFSSFSAFSSSALPSFAAFPLRFCSSFSHLDPKHGNARMVNVSQKEFSSQRIALARAIIKFPPGILPSLIAHSPKGDFFSVSRVAGILAAKKTHHLIPLCHPIVISHVNVSFQTDQENNRILVFCRVIAKHSQTGVEMEAMVGCSIAALCLYDMAKSSSLRIRLEAVELMGKRGGRRDFGKVDEEEEEGETKEEKGAREEGWQRKKDAKDN